jgi:hypothetical protein
MNTWMPGQNDKCHTATNMPTINSILIGLISTGFGYVIGFIQVNDTLSALWLGAVGAIGALTGRALWAGGKAIIKKVKNHKTNQ